MKRYIFMGLALFFGLFAAAGQHRTIIRGLEGHEEYRALLRQENTLVGRIDSLGSSIENLRIAARRDSLGHGTASADILRLEEECFGLRNNMAKVVGRINAIEQEWILQNLYAGLNDGDEGSTESGGVGTGADSGVERFEQNLTPEQLAELRQARRSEREVPALIERYLDNHLRLRALAAEYDLAETQNAADSIKTGFDIVASENRRLDGLIGSEWEVVFDAKSYIYNLVADKQNRSDMLALWENGMEQLRQELSTMQGERASETVTAYLLQKRMLTDYEIALAEEEGNRATADSLRRMALALPHPESMEGFDPVILRERMFFDYSDVRIGGSPYNASNPIPEVVVWPKGMMYRVLVGNFSTPQSPSVFRGAWPLAVEKGEDGRHRYFAGGFPSDSLAGTAVAQLRRAGFREPAAVVWIDGTYIDPKVAGEDKNYRIEISGTEELSSEMREAIEAQAGQGMILKSGGRFVVAPLDASVATKLRTALGTFDTEMEMRLSRIPE